MIDIKIYFLQIHEIRKLLLKKLIKHVKKIMLMRINQLRQKKVKGM